MAKNVINKAIILSKWSWHGGKFAKFVAEGIWQWTSTKFTSSDTKYESVKFYGSYTHVQSQGGIPQCASCNPLTFKHEAVKGSITFLKSLVSSITWPPTLPRWITNECGARFSSSGSSSAFAWILFLALRPCKQADRSLCTDKQTAITTLIMCTNN